MGTMRTAGIVGVASVIVMMTACEDEGEPAADASAGESASSSTGAHEASGGSTGGSSGSTDGAAASATGADEAGTSDGTTATATTDGSDETSGPSSGATSAEEGSEGSEGDSALASGCEVAHRLAFRGEFGFATSVAVRHIAGRVAAGPWRTDQGTGETFIQWAHFDLEAAAEYVYTSAAPGGGSIALPFAPHGVVTLGDAGTGNGITAATTDDGATEWTLAGAILEEVIVHPRVDFHANVSLDGERGLVVGQTNADEGSSVRMRMFSSEGVGVGETLTVAELGDCLAIVPTSQGLAYAQVEGEVLVLREVGPAGEIVGEPSIIYGTTAGETCPQIVLSDVGFAVLTAGDVLHHLPRDGTPTSEVWPGGEGIARAFAVSGDDIIAAGYVDQEPVITWRRNGQDEHYPLEVIGSFEQVPAEPGRLLLSVPNREDPAVLELLEITCSDERSTAP